MAKPEGPFVSRAGQKLQAALDAFCVDVTGLRCADFGCNVGGFTDCLLQCGAEHVFAIDTGYGELAWTLRQDPRVSVMERTNALHTDPPEQVDLVAMDLGWTPLVRAVPAALRWFAPAGGGELLALLKPHYEYTKIHGRKAYKPLDEATSRDIARMVQEQLADLPVQILAGMCSPLRGKGGNAEYLLWMQALDSASSPGPD